MSVPACFVRGHRRTNETTNGRAIKEKDESVLEAGPFVSDKINAFNPTTAERRCHRAGKLRFVIS